MDKFYFVFVFVFLIVIFVLFPNYIYSFSPYQDSSIVTLRDSKLNNSEIGIIYLASQYTSNLPLPKGELPPNLCIEVKNQGGKVLTKVLDFKECVGKIFYKVVQIILFFALIFATIFVTWSGILYITKSPNKEEIVKIHQRLIWAVIGLIIAFTAFFFVQLLERSIVTDKIIFFEIFKNGFVYAMIPQPSPPQELECGVGRLPSIFNTGQVLTSGIWKNCLWFYLGKIMIFLYRLALFLAVIFISWAGVLYITSPEKIKEIHKRLIWGVIGLLVAILSFTMVYLIESFFLNFMTSSP